MSIIINIQKYSFYNFLRFEVSRVTSSFEKPNRSRKVRKCENRREDKSDSHSGNKIGSMIGGNVVDEEITPRSVVN